MYMYTFVFFTVVWYSDIILCDILCIKIGFAAWKIAYKCFHIVFSHFNYDGFAFSVHFSFIDNQELTWNLHKTLISDHYNMRDVWKWKNDISLLFIRSVHLPANFGSLKFSKSIFYSGNLNIVLCDIGFPAINYNATIFDRFCFII